MENIERKTIQFTAERSPDEWTELFQFLGDKGITDIVQPPSDISNGYILESRPEIDDQLSLDFETQPPLSKPLSKSDIFDVANRLGYSDKLAGRAWGIVTRLFTLKDNPELFSGKSWFDDEGYGFVPLRFNDIPAKDIYGRYDSDKLSGLQPESLQELLDLYDRKLDKATNCDARIEVRNKILGVNAGRLTINLLRMIAIETIQIKDLKVDTNTL